MGNINGKIKLIYLVNIVLIVIMFGYLMRNWIIYSKTVEDNNISEEKTEIVDGINEVEFKDYTFQIPTSYEFTTYEDNDNRFSLIMNDYQAETYIELLKMSDLNYSDDINILYKNIIETGNDVREPKKIVLDNHSINTMTFYNEEYKALLAYIPYNDDDLFEITLYTKDNEINYDYLEDIFKIIINAKHGS